jgi:ribose transport system substrate-binding protein
VEREKEMSNSAMRVQTARVAAAVAIACIVGCGAGAQAASENLLEGLPDNLKPLYEGATDALQPSAYDNFKMPPPPWK